jgi:hypothetical protein
MASSAVKQRLAQDVGQWITDGLIGAEAAAPLRTRWDQPGLGLAQIVKYLSLSGALLIAFGLFGAIAAASGSPLFAGVMVCGAGSAGLYFGVLLARDRAGRYAASCNVVLALGFLAFALGAGLIAAGVGLRTEAAVVGAGALTLPIGFFLAYTYRNTFLLVLSLLSLFHWVGSWTHMSGDSSYVFSIQEPLVMAPAALCAVAFGVYTERVLADGRNWPRFHHAYQATGLVYLNMSLLILGFEGTPTQTRGFIALWALAGTAQIIAGARLHSPLLTAFGVTALAINLYTRYYEHFWDAMDAGLFMLVGGVVMFAVGMACERSLRSKAV